MSNPFKIATAAVAVLMALPVTMAGAADSPLRVVVRHADLDLARPGDRVKLDRRVARAVEAACGSYAQATPEEQRDIAACRARAFAQLRPVASALVARAGGPSAIVSR